MKLIKSLQKLRWMSEQRADDLGFASRLLMNF